MPKNKGNTALARAERQQRVSKAAAKAAPVETTAPAPTVRKGEIRKIEQPAAPAPELDRSTRVRGKSIRGLITGMIAEGKSTQEITEAVKEAFPNSQAAAKSTKHIAFYRSRMKKDAAKGQAKAEVQAEAAK